MSEDPRVELRTAATRLREWAAQASPGPWSAGDVDDESGEFFYRYGDYGWYVTGPAGSPELADSEQAKADARWIALMGPDMAEHIAAWLEYEAENLDEWFNVGALQRGVTVRSNPGRDAALRLATAVLASQQQETQPPTEED